jgi:hypothetical protein
MMMHDAKKKITSNSNIGEFSGSLQWSSDLIVIFITFGILCTAVDDY